MRFFSVYYNYDLSISYLVNKYDGHRSASKAVLRWRPKANSAVPLRNN